ncbi:Excisionase [Georgfuchsia toluolica]|uniref:Excisionase n=1 Tax=Georgfuchsia toluolica TaxID=424218 RepID=A0A916J703_9PROT|nr:excisionase family protein [Georgfuchsia toluolica]CAG4885097.1 Excisionase [Georgfuchsia toluolica]
MFDWVLINKVIELVGYSDDAIRAKIKKGVWLSGVHFRKAPDGRIFFHLPAIKQWIEGKA